MATPRMVSPFAPTFQATTGRAIRKMALGMMVARKAGTGSFWS